MSEIIEHMVALPSFDPQIDEVLFSGISQTNPLHELGPLIHSYHLVHYVIRGKGTMTLKKHTYHLQSGDSFFIFPDESVHYIADEFDPWYYCWIAFKGSRFSNLLKTIRITPDQPIVTNINQEELLPLFHDIRNSLHEGTISHRLKASSVLQQLLACYCRERERQHIIKPHKSPSQIAIDEVTSYIDYNYMYPITISELANKIGYHRSHLCKLFKSIHGISPLSYLTKVRIEQAQLLLSQQIPINQVAKSIGIHDSLYFSKIFKQYMKMTPSQFQQQQRKN